MLQHVRAVAVVRWALEAQRLREVALLEGQVDVADIDGGKIIADGKEMLQAAGAMIMSTMDTPGTPGLGIHEMGTACMGRDPKTSLLNRWNQLHACTNVFVTDGASMASTGTQNPSLTYMALSARAAHYAVEFLRSGKL